MTRQEFCEACCTRSMQSPVRRSGSQSAPPCAQSFSSSPHLKHPRKVLWTVMSCDTPSGFRNVLTLNDLEKRVSLSYIVIHRPSYIGLSNGDQLYIRRQYRQYRSPLVRNSLTAPRYPVNFLMKYLPSYLRSLKTAPGSAWHASGFIWVH